MDALLSILASVEALDMHRNNCETVDIVGVNLAFDRIFEATV